MTHPRVFRMGFRWVQSRGSKAQLVFARISIWHIQKTLTCDGYFENTSLSHSERVNPCVLLYNTIRTLSRTHGTSERVTMCCRIVRRPSYSCQNINRHPRVFRMGSRWVQSRGSKAQLVFARISIWHIQKTLTCDGYFENTSLSHSERVNPCVLLYNTIRTLSRTHGTSERVTMCCRIVRRPSYSCQNINRTHSEYINLWWLF